MDEHDDGGTPEQVQADAREAEGSARFDEQRLQFRRSMKCFE
jgi:hypothetical protein